MGIEIYFMERSLHYMNFMGRYWVVCLGATVGGIR